MNGFLWQVSCDECGLIGEPTTNYAAFRKAIRHAESECTAGLPEGQLPIMRITQLEKLGK